MTGLFVFSAVYRKTVVLVCEMILILKYWSTDWGKGGYTMENFGRVANRRHKKGRGKKR